MPQCAHQASVYTGLENSKNRHLPFKVVGFTDEFPLVQRGWLLEMLIFFFENIKEFHILTNAFLDESCNFHYNCV